MGNISLFSQQIWPGICQNDCSTVFLFLFLITWFRSWVCKGSICQLPTLLLQPRPLVNINQDNRIISFNHKKALWNIFLHPTHFIWLWCFFITQQDLKNFKVNVWFCTNYFNLVSCYISVVTFHLILQNLLSCKE